MLQPPEPWGCARCRRWHLPSECDPLTSWCGCVCGLLEEPMVTPAPAAKAFRAEMTRRCPKRSQVSDGILSSDAHKKQNPTSRHDLGDAVDITHDPAAGCDMNVIAEQVRQRCIAGDLPQVDQIIWNRRIATAAKGWRWRPYGGSNPHNKHAHFSIVHRYRDRTTVWLPQRQSIKTTPKPAPPKETDMPLTEPEWQRLEALLDEKLRIVLRGEAEDGRPTGHPNLTRITENIAALDVPRKAAR